MALGCQKADIIACAPHEGMGDRSMNAKDAREEASDTVFVAHLEDYVDWCKASLTLLSLE